MSTRRRFGWSGTDLDERLDLVKDWRDRDGSALGTHGPQLRRKRTHGLVRELDEGLWARGAN